MSNLLPGNSPSPLVPHSCRKYILASILGGWVKSAYFTFEVFLVFFNIFYPRKCLKHTYFTHKGPVFILEIQFSFMFRVK